MGIDSIATRETDEPAGLGIRLFLVGPFQVLGPDQEDLTPRGRKACGLLALLALSKNGVRPRASVQDKLWSDRGEEQAANSLRQALSEIRKSLGEYRDYVKSDRRDVALNLDRVTIDLDEAEFGLSLAGHRGEQPVLLEGLDIRDPEFENWLRDQRASFEDRLQASVAPTAPSSPIKIPSSPSLNSSDLSSRPWVRILPPTVGDTAEGTFFSKMISETISRGVRERGAADITTETRDTPGIDLQVDVLPLTTGTAVNVTMFEAHGQRLLWSGTRHVSKAYEFIADDKELQLTVNQAIDISINQLRRLTSETDTDNAFALGYDAVQKMFRLDRHEILEADKQLDEAHARDPNGVFLAWKAYARTFFTGEHMVDAQDQAEEARRLVREAIQSDPQNSVVLALSSYVHSFLLREYTIGHEFAEESLKFNAGNPLGLAFLGRAKSYLGDHDEGYKLLMNARAVSGPSPFRYTLDFMCGVTAALSGRHEVAIHLEEIARVMEPEYKAPLRTLLALYLKHGERDKAREVFAKIRETEPDFSLRVMREQSYPSTGLRAAGLLDQIDDEFE